MFAQATSKFVSEIDTGGCLIPVSNLNEVDNLKLLSLVIKRNRFWFWQKPKYIPSDFTLNDVLLEKKDIDPGFIENDFMNYSRTFENNVSGSGEASFGPGNIHLEGKGSSKLAFSFGNLKKQEVELQKLLDNCKGRVLDTQHSLLQQTRKKCEVLTLVKERIITTQTCTITEEVHEGHGFGGCLGLTLPKKINVSLKNGSHQSDSNVSVKIPAKTPLAYCLTELSVKATGHFEMCVRSDTSGGFDVDAPELECVEKLYTTPPEAPNKQLQKELDKLQSQFTLLSKLPPSTRSSLHQQITLLLKDKTAISALDLALEDLCCGRKPDLSTLDKDPSLKAAVQATLEVLQSRDTSDHAPLESPSSEEQLQPTALTAAQVLTSALAEMTESNLLLLESCSCPTTIQAFHSLVQKVVKDDSQDISLGVLAEKDTYNKVDKLFGSSNITLHKTEDSVCAEISSQEGHDPLIFCIAICGLGSLVTPM